METDRRLHQRDGMYGFAKHLLDHIDNPEFDPAIYDHMAQQHHGIGSHEISRLYKSVADYRRSLAQGVAPAPPQAPTPIRPPRMTPRPRPPAAPPWLLKHLGFDEE
jgi:hypothetical protein